MRQALPLIAVLALPVTAFAAPVWSSNFESGTTAGWSKIQSVSEDRVQVVQSPVREGQKALKVTVHQGDDPINSGNDRAELVYMSLEQPNSEYFYRWSVMFPADYPSHPKWQLFAQWHQEGLAGTPPFEMYIVGEEMRLRTGGHEGPVIWTAPLERGKWHDFVLHVKWSSDPKVGFVEMHHNGKMALPRTATPTQLPGQVNYFKMGLYRSKEIAQTASVYFDDVRMGTAMADVQDAPAQQPPAQQPPAQQPPAQEQPVSGGTTPPIAGGDDTGIANPDPTSPPTDGEITPEELQSQMGGGCTTGGAGTLPLAAAVAGLGLVGLVRRRKTAAVTVPVKASRRRR